MNNLKDVDDKIQRLTKKLIKEKKKENIIIATCAEFFSGVFVTSLIGYFLDYVFATKYIFLVSFIVLGFVVGFFNIYRLLKGR